jgi:hypothetical protein
MLSIFPAQTEEDIGQARELFLRYALQSDECT